VRKNLENISDVFKILFRILIDPVDSNPGVPFNLYKRQIYDYIHKSYPNSGHVSTFMMVFLVAAMKHNRHKIIDAILEVESFYSLKMNFPEKINSKEMTSHVALKMLQKQYYIGSNQIPESWITSKVLQEFLDSRVTYQNDGIVKIDYNFMLHPYTKTQKVDFDSDIDDTLVFAEDVDALLFFKNQESGQNAITHPVISTYINLKFMKYRRICAWNLFLFLLLVATPFFLFFKMQFFKNADDLEKSVLKYIMASWSVVGIGFVAGREIFQYQNFDNYSQKSSNKLEFALLLGSFIVYGSIWLASTEIAAFAASVYVLLLSTEIICMIPISSSQHHKFIIKNVVKNFQELLFSYGLMILPFAFCFCVISGSKVEGSLHENFSNFGSSLLKVLMMLSGEYSLEIKELNKLEMIFVGFYVLTTFWLFALIVGFSVSDVNEMKLNAKRNILKENIEKVIEFEKYFRRVYDDHE
jgi:hypothetical protein